MSAPIILEPIGWVRSPRVDIRDGDWGRVRARIELAPGLSPSSLRGLDAFSHVEILFIFDRVASGAVTGGARRPRGNPAWPEVGIFAQRAKRRPNRLGSMMLRLVGCGPSWLEVEGLDAIDGTPVVDIKPVMREFLPREPVRQPEWAGELMRSYWDGPGDVV